MTVLLLLALLTLSTAAVVGTIRTVVTDGYRPAPVRTS